MNRRGVFATIMVIQLIFLVMLAIFVIENEKVNFEYEQEYRRLAAYRVSALYEDIEEGMIELDSDNLNANDATKQTYINFVNTQFPNYYAINIYFNGSYLKISDANLEISKEGWI
jgi:hypothetical protein